MKHIKAHNVGFLTESWNLKKQLNEEITEDSEVIIQIFTASISVYGGITTRPEDLKWMGMISEVLKKHLDPRLQFGRDDDRGYTFLRNLDETIKIDKNKVEDVVNKLRQRYEVDMEEEMTDDPKTGGPIGILQVFIGKTEKDLGFLRN